MTKADLASFQEILRAKKAELAHNTLGVENIAIERSADAIEEAQYKFAREVAITDLNRQSSVCREVAMALLRIQEGAFGACVHCGNDIGRRRLEALPWTPLCIRCQEAADRGEESVFESVEPTFLDAA
jgi:DnaK suppressor protein